MLSHSSPKSLIFCFVLFLVDNDRHFLLGASAVFVFVMAVLLVLFVLFVRWVGGQHTKTLRTYSCARDAWITFCSLEKCQILCCSSFWFLHGHWLRSGFSSSDYINLCFKQTCNHIFFLQHLSPAAYLNQFIPVGVS